jgi:hypothetical protein
LVGVVGPGRAIEWVGTYLPVAALLGMVVITFAAFAVYLLLLWVASQGQGGTSGPLLSVSQE